MKFIRKNLLLKRKILLFTYRTIRKIFAGKGLKKYSFIQSVNSIFKDKLFVNFIEIDGNKMYLGVKGGDSLELSSMGSYEPFETEIIKKNIKEGDHVVDLGASVGYYTLLMAKWVGETGKVYSFEANPEKFSILEKNVQLNNYQNVTLIHKMVSNKSTHNLGIQSIASIKARGVVTPSGWSALTQTCISRGYPIVFRIATNASA